MSKITLNIALGRASIKKFKKQEMQWHQKTSFWACKIMAEWEVYSINQESQITKDGPFNADPLKAALYYAMTSKHSPFKACEKMDNLHIASTTKFILYSTYH